MLDSLGPFQKNVIIISCVLLIIALGVIGYVLSQGAAGTKWPPSVSNCPDYWEDQKGDGSSCWNVKRLGKCGNGPYNLTGWTKSKNACGAKRIMDQCKLTWDGITSVDPCSEAYRKAAQAEGSW